MHPISYERNEIAQVSFFITNSLLQRICIGKKRNEMKNENRIENRNAQKIMDPLYSN